jgi:hypothetical protein
MILQAFPDKLKKHHPGKTMCSGLFEKRILPQNHEGEEKKVN